MNTSFLKEDGYTLIESLVAMSIFVSVLIPLGSVVGNILIMSDNSMQRQALQIAQNEIRSVLESSHVFNAEKKVEIFIVKTESVQSARLQSVTVRVSRESRRTKVIVVLHKKALKERWN